MDSETRPRGSMDGVGAYLSVLAECILEMTVRDTRVQAGDMKVCAWVTFVSANKPGKKHTSYILEA